MNDREPAPTSQPTLDIDDDTPLTLEEACREIFRGTIKPATLMAEARRGRLVIERIGRRNFVTRAAIKSMRDACRVQPTPPPVLVSWKAPQRSAATDPKVSAAALQFELDRLKEMDREKREKERQKRRLERAAWKAEQAAEKGQKNR